MADSRGSGVPGIQKEKKKKTDDRDNGMMNTYD